MNLPSKFLLCMAFLGLLLPLAGWADDEMPVGLSKMKPDSGRYVETEQGFMVPYAMKIPGTDAEFAMEPIPGGTFLVGSPESEAGHQAAEGPPVEIRVAPFWMGRYEVTWSEYKEFMKLYAIFKQFASEKIRPVTEQNRVDAITAPTELYDPSFTFELGEEPRQPAVTMTQYAAKQYTRWLSAITGQTFRLPSESEWEYACRAGQKTAYHFGDDAGQLGEYAWFFDNSEEKPQLVGQKKPNDWGLFDMHGNVWEWCLDQYLEDGYARLANLAKPIDSAATVAWPTQQYPRVVRGGSWDDDPANCRSAAKMGSNDLEWKSEDPNLPHSPWWYTSDPARGVGFRLLRPLQAMSKTEFAKYYQPDVEAVQVDVDIRLEEGRGVLGLVDPELPGAIAKLKAGR